MKQTHYPALLPSLQSCYKTPIVAYTSAKHCSALAPNIRLIQGASVKWSSQWLEKALMVVTTGCAVVVTVAVLRTRSAAPSTKPVAEQKEIKDWARYASSGRRIGPDSAAVTIIEFADFECPVCAHFSTTALKEIRTKYPMQVAVVFRHWPLPYHRLAYPAARAAECAASQSRFEAFHDLLYSDQDSLGLKTFSAFAKESGVPDMAAFEACNAAAGKIPQVEDDIAAVKELGGHGTPTLIINGLMLVDAPDTEHLDSLVRSAISRSGSFRE